MCTTQKFQLPLIINQLIILKLPSAVPVGWMFPFLSSKRLFSSHSRLLHWWRLGWRYRHHRAEYLLHWKSGKLGPQASGAGNLYPKGDDLMLNTKNKIAGRFFTKQASPLPRPLPCVVSSDELETILAGDETVIMSTVTVGWLIADFLGVWYVIILRSLYYSSRQLGDQRTQSQGKNILTSEIFPCLASAMAHLPNLTVSHAY